MKRREFIQGAGIFAASALAKPRIAHPTSAQMHTRDFSFIAADVLSALRNSPGSLQYVGSATSHFQAEPLVLDKKSAPIVTSDWEMEVMKNIDGKHSNVSGPQNPNTFPHFLPKKNDYAARSAEMGENMFRFSLDFARLCPREDDFNVSLMFDYVRVLAQIRARGLEPMLTIHHWPMPKFLLKLDKNANIVNGGWEHPQAFRHFRFYINSVLSFLGDDDKVRSALQAEGLGKEMQEMFLSEGLVHYFVTINEPTSILMNGYMFGSFPPYKKGKLADIRRVLRTLVDAHSAAFVKIKESALRHKWKSKVGVAYNWTYFDGVLGGTFRKNVDEKITEHFESGGVVTDFLGLQYYCRITVPSLYPPIGPLRPKDRQYGDHPDFGDVYPPGIHKVLHQMNALYPKKDIFITEFGFSDLGDKRRPYWILETVRHVFETLKSGVVVKGILLWSLVNNFEWQFGMNQKFGLFDEADLGNPLESSSNEVRGWQAWRAAINVMRNPTPEGVDKLQTCYQQARLQFERATSQRL